MTPMVHCCCVFFFKQFQMMVIISMVKKIKTKDMYQVSRGKNISDFVGGYNCLQGLLLICDQTSWNLFFSFKNNHHMSGSLCWEQSLKAILQ